MTDPELTHRNFFRINLINWSLTLPMLFLFAWPYYLICRWLGIGELLSYFGALLFAFPFMITILHGHVTMALGAIHRHHYYEWLSRYPLTYGFLFHPVMFRTRFRFSLILFSISILAIALLSR
jgi:hypothetical protein